MAFGELRTEDVLYFQAELDRAHVADLRGKRVIEVGFGNGTFAAWSRSVGADYSGVEQLPELVESARQAGFDARGTEVRLTEHFPKNSADLIVAFDVLEHLPIEQLIATIKDMGELLRVDGLLLARIPSGDSPFGRAIQYGDISHRCVLGSTAVRQIGLCSGLEVVYVTQPAFPLRGLGVRSFIRRACVAIVTALVSRFLVRTLMGGGPAVLTANLVFLMRKR